MANFSVTPASNGYNTPEQQQCWQTISPSWQQHFQSPEQLLPQARPLVHQTLEKQVESQKTFVITIVTIAFEPPGQRFCQKIEWLR